LEVYNECNEIGKAILSQYITEDDVENEIRYDGPTEASASEIFQSIYQQISPTRRIQLARLEYINVKLCSECLIPCDKEKCNDCVQLEQPPKLDKGKGKAVLEPIEEEIIISEHPPQLEWTNLKEDFAEIYQALDNLKEKLQLSQPIENTGYYAVKVYNDQGKGKLPEKAHSTDAGYDVFYTGEKEEVIPAHKVLLVDIYIAIEIPVGVMCQVMSRSSLAKQGINVKGGVIDSGYTGNISVIIQNDSEEDFLLKPQQKIAQLVFLQLASIDSLQPVETRKELGQTSRGTDGFGSTDLTEAQTYFLEQEREEKIIEQRKLTEDQERRLIQLLEDNADIFTTELHQLGRSNIIKHEIHTGNESPIKQRPYRATLPDQQFISEEIKRMLDANIIRPSTSPWASPIVVVSKKNGKKRFCVDYRKVNAITRKDAYPLPRIDEMMDSLGSAHWFSSMDLTSGYWQIEMEENSKAKTAFTSREGLFEFNVMPFGLCNAPATFQRAMDTVLGDYNWKFANVYIDDLNVFSKDFTEHLDHLNKVFCRIRTANLKLNPEKCNFCRKELPFLGHIITDEGISPDPSTIKKIQEFPQPRTIKGLRSFLGLAGYYRKFVKGFSQIAAPLFKLLRNNEHFIWTVDQESAFQQLKQLLTSAPILIYPDFTKKFYLYTDASDTGLGAVLSQKDKEGREQVVAYASVTLKPAEQKYGVTEKEALAVVWAVRQFRHYLLGTVFEIITDHNALRWLFKNQQSHSARVNRWIMSLMEYQFIVTYRPGRKNQNADALSRMYSEEH
jgi:deoxyuridine 5'-triphosphate nucleotidohydrolase